MNRRTIFIHYEEYGDIDFKLKLTDHMLAQWLMKLERTTLKGGMAMLQAKKKARPSDWLEEFTEDERMYQYLKARYENEAYKRLFPKDTYTIAWYESANLKTKSYYTKEFADRFFNEMVKKNKSEVVMFYRHYNNDYHSNPIRRTPMATLLAKDFIANYNGAENKHSDEYERKQCMRRRAVSRCSQCSRHNVYGPSGCTFYTMKVDKGAKT